MYDVSSKSDNGIVKYRGTIFRRENLKKNEWGHN